MSTTDIYIARHGETKYNREGKMQGRGIDAPLNKTGRLQARAISDELKDKSIDHIFSSSLVRSMETAEIVAWTFRMKYHSYPELDEMNFGKFEGRASKDIEQELNEVHRTWQNGNTDYAIDGGGESPVMVLERVNSRMNNILNNHSGSTLLFVLHGRLIRIVLSHWLGYPLSDMHRIEHSNGALYHFLKNDNSLEMGYLHKTDHLEGIMDEEG
ncbi:histidine phosphatase family protein [Balneolaceae bacterium YR4-1]|uniref:Histidine phosphatase family protein n=1 Tax=Halalkalibaculum roseum TaxID=2709311 RepID=A0A6M1T547_9BACT|nr:histidine phosphatase family protein [Halalkalibaculum roseum]NGP77115.1 histidine phosphatase family protein [Halalkalibaculum roseum]